MPSPIPCRCDCSEPIFFAVAHKVERLGCPRCQANVGGADREELVANWNAKMADTSQPRDGIPDELCLPGGPRYGPNGIEHAAHPMVEEEADEDVSEENQAHTIFQSEHRYLEKDLESKFGGRFSVKWKPIVDNMCAQFQSCGRYLVFHTATDGAMRDFRFPIINVLDLQGARDIQQQVQRMLDHGFADIAEALSDPASFI